MQELTDIRARVREANKVIAIVAALGRRFLYSQAHERVARLGTDGHGQCWFVDAASGMKLYPFEGGDWSGFTGGQVERVLVERLALYCRDGCKLGLDLFPVDIDPWGYGFPTMREVRSRVLDTDAVVS